MNRADQITTCQICDELGDPDPLAVMMTRAPDACPSSRRDQRLARNLPSWMALRVLTRENVGLTATLLGVPLGDA